MYEDRKGSDSSLDSRYLEAGNAQGALYLIGASPEPIEG